ncbi:MAG: hypothetical protein Q7J55_05380 [bacterium]|nr:hypothetical protein [bacterium]
MKKKLSILDSSRFEKMERDKLLWLKSLTMKKALRLEESLISSELIWEWRKNFFPDRPLCLRDSLEKSRKNVIRRGL